MTITDTCRCGAEFHFSVGNGFGATNVDDRKMLDSKHTEWLAAHAVCREKGQQHDRKHN